ncbi:MAG: hypothetical protein ACETV1_01045 [Candidatus Bathyarchaeia archaeon]
MDGRPFCCVCGETKNPIIIFTVGDRNFYFCLEHACEARDELEDQLKGIDHIQKIREWAREEGIFNDRWNS